MRLAAAILLALNLLAGCGPAAVSLARTPKTYTPDDYHDVYEKWTRSTNSFSFGRLESILHATATFQSWDFRWAYAIRYAADHSLSTADRELLLNASLEDSRSFHRFFVTLAGRDWRSSDLTSTRSAWRLLLVDDRGRTYLPVQLDRVDEPTPAERAYYPSISPFRQVFRVAFPVTNEEGQPIIAEETQWITIRFAGPQGTEDLRWNFRNAPRQ